MKEAKLLRPGGRLRWIIEFRIGVIPLPVYLLLGTVITYFVRSGTLPNDISASIAVLMLFGFGFAELGKRLPLIGRIGGATLSTAFAPAALVHYHLLPTQIVALVTNFTTSSNFLFVFIAAIVVGSVLSLDRDVLVGGLARIFLPLAVGTVCAAVCGTVVGALLGLGAWHTLFFVVIPIMAGGVGEGAVPLSIAYADVLHGTQGEIFARILPVAMLGNFVAIVLSSTLDKISRRHPRLTGSSQLRLGGVISPGIKPDAERPPMRATNVAAAAVMTISLYLLGVICHDLCGLPAPLVLLFVAVALKLTNSISPQLQVGSRAVCRFFQVGVTYPLLFAISVSATPWQALVEALTWGNVLTVGVTVVAMIASGFIVGRWNGFGPIEAATINACHTGLGGTGDIAILTSANRMELMPFAQIATRIGGAVTVTAAIIAMTYLERQ